MICAALPLWVNPSRSNINLTTNSSNLSSNFKPNSSRHHLNLNNNHHLNPNLQNPESYPAPTPKLNTPNPSTC